MAGTVSVPEASDRGRERALWLSPTVQHFNQAEAKHLLDGAEPELAFTEQHGSSLRRTYRTRLLAAKGEMVNRPWKQRNDGSELGLVDTPQSQHWGTGYRGRQRAL